MHPKYMVPKEIIGCPFAFLLSGKGRRHGLWRGIVRQASIGTRGFGIVCHDAEMIQSAGRVIKRGRVAIGCPFEAMKIAQDPVPQSKGKNLWRYHIDIRFENDDGTILRAKGSIVLPGEEPMNFFSTT